MHSHFLSKFGIPMVAVLSFITDVAALPPPIRCTNVNYCPPLMARHSEHSTRRFPQLFPGDISNGDGHEKLTKLHFGSAALSRPAIDGADQKLAVRSINPVSVTALTEEWEQFKKQWPGIDVTLKALDKAGTFGVGSEHDALKEALARSMRHFGKSMEEVIKTPTAEKLKTLAASREDLSKRFPGIPETVDALDRAGALPAKDGISARQRRTNLTLSMKGLLRKIKDLMELISNLLPP